MIYDKCRDVIRTKARAGPPSPFGRNPTSLTEPFGAATRKWPFIYSSIYSRRGVNWLPLRAYIAFAAFRWRDHIPQSGRRVGSTPRSDYSPAVTAYRCLRAICEGVDLGQFWSGCVFSVVVWEFGSILKNETASSRLVFVIVCQPSREMLLRVHELMGRVVPWEDDSRPLFMSDRAGIPSTRLN
jgi:hypothetical protein